MFNQYTKKFVQVSCAITLAFALGACSSKKKTEETTTEQVQQAPQIDNTAMSFDAAGSDSGNISGLQTVNFDYDKATLSAETKKKIAGNVDWMKSKANVNIQIEGHCDARGSIEYNLSLGERRARSVKDYMVSLGIPAARLSIISYGKEKPLAKGDDEASYSKNRRANFVPLAQ
ncbi:MAG: hypothetical protein BroJett040_05520 [Oligoflexia bacterium]|nr:MAG: hypothetical protein BroJett040_05520 [Oligoflexia bacterium]